MPITGADSTFYRVSVKALIFDGQRRLLVFQDKAGKWELPGGGLEHDESLEGCLIRELDEEVQAKPAHIGKIAFVYQCTHENGYQKLCLAVPVRLPVSAVLQPTGDDLVVARYVARKELAGLPFQSSEAGVQTCLDQIWPAVEKKVLNR